MHLRLRDLEQVPMEPGAVPLGPLPIGEILHPLALLALGVLVVNDWWAKAAWPGLVTGKLSDVAGLVVAPLALGCALGCARYLLWAGGLPLCPSGSRRRLLGCSAAVALAFIACKLSPAAAHATAAALGVLGGQPRIVSDPTDLWTLPSLGIAWWVGRRELALVPRGYAHFALRAPGAAAGRLRDVRWAGAAPHAVEELARALSAGDRAAVNRALLELGTARA